MGASHGRSSVRARTGERGLPEPKSVLYLGCPRHRGESVAGPCAGEPCCFTGCIEVAGASSSEVLRRRSFEKGVGADREAGSSTEETSEASSSSSGSEPWGWFLPGEEEIGRGGSPPRKQYDTPAYVLEESLGAQALWHLTAGKRPKQPEKKRREMEELWRLNFERSAVPFSIVHATAPTPKSRSASVSSADPREMRRENSDTPAKGAQRGMDVVDRLTCPYGYAASKSFSCDRCDHIASVMVYVPRVRVVRSSGGGARHAEYLLVIDNGALTFGKWCRYSSFVDFYREVVRGDPRHFSRTRTAWAELQFKRKWRRCLERDYLISKCFFLERFLQSLLAESPTPATISKLIFGDADAPPGAVGGAA